MRYFTILVSTLTDTIHTIKENKMIKVTGLTKNAFSEQKNKKILNNVTFQIKTGETIIITGPAGSGKTILLKILASLEKSDAGKILVNKKSVPELNDRQLMHYRKEDLGLIFQDVPLIDSLTIKENLELVAAQAPFSYDITYILAQVGIHEELDRFPTELSSGDYQLVLLARALVKKPKLLLLDDPLSSLDSHSAQTILTLLQETAKKRGTTIVLTMKQTQLIPYADRVFTLLKGQITSIKSNKKPAKTADLIW
ncbi:hypothetical protein CKN63_02740 [Carnobacterium divergens]|nr:hypothetical protein CKN59_02700 [Carnobacterium divergens]TFI68119.1 hypothetical protein CKN76_02775 [Carnobacterium divergens]TFI82920.1 hypothetical protein CKN74_02740 [Carnobacterium divergens]TFJ09065.1 hypothetical protein CKN75_02770 [Carnobacterium divergens]TFJ14199.1 hypothetical protein CKN71_02770 [Carnobacterium divergens]